MLSKEQQNSQRTWGTVGSLTWASPHHCPPRPQPHGSSLPGSPPPASWPPRLSLSRLHEDSLDNLAKSQPHGSLGLSLT